MFSLCDSVQADAITFAGSNIPLRDCRIEAIQAEALTFVDSRGQRRRIGMEQVRAIGFADLPQLDQAERSLAEGLFERGRDHLLAALLSAKTDLQRLWIRARLAQTHAAHDQYVQAASHAAVAMQLGNEAAWRRLEPLGGLNQADEAAVKEAVFNLQAARQAVNSHELRAAIQRMLAKLQPLTNGGIAGNSNASPAHAAATYSGFTAQEILARISAASAPTSQAPIIESLTPDAPWHAAEPAPAAAAPIPPDVSDPTSPSAIDALLSQRRWADALRVCEQVAQDPGQRDLAKLLNQYGLALAHTGQPRKAAIMFSRCFVLFPDSPDAPSSMIETAVIYRDTYRSPAAARRLLELAVGEAAAQGQEAVGRRAQELLSSL